VTLPKATRPAEVPRRSEAPTTSPPPSPLALVDPDREIVARVRAGDEMCFAALFRSHHAPLCDYALRIVGDPDAAQDLVQSALFGVWRHRERWELQRGGSVQAYLYAAVRNAALQYRNHERLVRRVHDASAERGAMMAMGRSAGAADDVLATHDLEIAFVEALDLLPPRCREAFVLRRTAGLSVADVARVMGIAPKTVEVHIGAALRALRVRLRDWTGGPRAREAEGPKGSS